MKRIVGTVAALAAALALGPAGVAHAEDPFSCNGSPEIPDTYFCIVRFQVGADPTVEQVPVGVPGQPVEVESETIEAGGDDLEIVPSQTVTVPSVGTRVPVVCAGVSGFCVGPFAPSTPVITLTTPAVRQDVPVVEQETPEINQTTPPVSGYVPVAGADVPPGAIVVVWYRGTCTYLYPDGSLASAGSASPSGCP